MHSVRTILCAVDFSADSRQAVLVALALARSYDARLVALHVIDLLLAEASSTIHRDDRLAVETESALRLFVEAECDRARHEHVDTVVRIGVPDREVLAAAGDLPADVIVMGTRGISGVSKLFFGSVTEKVLRRSAVPVFAVTAGGGRPTAFSRVIAAVDVDETSERVASQAAALARDLRLPLALVHVVRPLPTGCRWADALQASTPARVYRAKQRLRDVAMALDVTAQIDVRVGHPPEQVAAAAAERPGSLLVVGLDGDTPLGRVGSTAYRIVCASQTPLMAVPVVTPHPQSAAPRALAETT